MRAIISILRGVNVGGKNRVKMQVLREIYEGLQLFDSQTYVQSGNVVFRTEKRDLRLVAKEIQEGIAGKCGFSPEVVLRTVEEWRRVIAKNPFGRRKDVEPHKLLVQFLTGDPGEEARKAVRKMKTAPEELRIEGRELFIYFPNGIGQSKFPWAALDEKLKVTGTGRNWNSVNRICEMAEDMEKKQVSGRNL